MACPSSGLTKLLGFSEIFQHSFCSANGFCKAFGVTENPLSSCSAYFSEKSVKALEWAAQGGGGIWRCSRNVRCCTEGHGLVGDVEDRWMVGLVDLRGLFQPW